MITRTVSVSKDNVTNVKDCKENLRKSSKGRETNVMDWQERTTDTKGHLEHCNSIKNFLKDRLLRLYTQYRLKPRLRMNGEIWKKKNEDGTVKNNFWFVKNN